MVKVKVLVIRFNLEPKTNSTTKLAAGPNPNDYYRLAL